MEPLWRSLRTEKRQQRVHPNDSTYCNPGGPDDTKTVGPIDMRLDRVSVTQLARVRNTKALIVCGRERVPSYSCAAMNCVSERVKDTITCTAHRDVPSMNSMSPGIETHAMGLFESDGTSSRLPRAKGVLGSDKGILSATLYRGTRKDTPGEETSSSEPLESSTPSIVSTTGAGRPGSIEMLASLPLL
jgi:hypothetical protein